MLYTTITNKVCYQIIYWWNNIKSENSNTDVFYGEITHNSTLRPRRTNTDIAQIVILYSNVDVSTMLFHVVHKDTVWPKMENENFFIRYLFYFYL